MENLLGPRDANGIPVPLTVEESIASMKASLLKKSNARPTSIAWTAAAATAVRSKSSPPCHRCLTPNASASKWCRPRATRISCCSPARSPARCARLRCAHGSLRRIENLHLLRRLRQQRRHLPRSLLRLGRHRQNRAGGRLHSGLPADARRHAVRFCHGARPAGAEDPRPRAGRAGQPASHSPAPGYGAAAAGEDRSHGAQAGGLPLWPSDCRRLSASAERGDHQVARWLEAENDPRLNEIVANLNSIVDEARIR